MTCRGFSKQSGILYCFCTKKKKKTGIESEQRNNFNRQKKIYIYILFYRGDPSKVNNDALLFPLNVLFSLFRPHADATAGPASPDMGLIRERQSHRV